MINKKILLTIIIPVSSIVLGMLVFFISKKYSSRMAEMFQEIPYASPSPSPGGCIQCNGTLTKVCDVAPGFPPAQVQLTVHSSGQPCCLQCNADRTECIGGYARDCSGGCTKTGVSPIQIDNLDCYTSLTFDCQCL